MTSEEIITIINTLCDKLGLAVDSVGELIPELARAKITWAIVEVVTFSLLILISGIALWATYRKGKKWLDTQSKWNLYITDYVPFLISMVVFGIAVIVGVVSIVMGAATIAKWTISPTWAAIEYILGLV